jgi:hypothetical protein
VIKQFSILPEKIILTGYSGNISVYHLLLTLSHAEFLHFNLANHHISQGIRSGAEYSDRCGKT